MADKHSVENADVGMPSSATGTHILDTQQYHTQRLHKTQINLADHVQLGDKAPYQLREAA